jgi:hypothetical protein
VHYSERPPDATLRRFVDAFWTLSSGGAPAPTEAGTILPDGMIEIVVWASVAAHWNGVPAPPRYDSSMDKAARDAIDRAARRRMSDGPIVTAIVQRNGFGSVPFAMARAFIIYMMSSLVLTWLLMHSNQSTYWERVIFVAAIGLAAGLICRLPDWNWHGYSTAYTLVNVADHTTGAFLVGLALARIV